MEHQAEKDRWLLTAEEVVRLHCPLITVKLGKFFILIWVDVLETFGSDLT